MFQCRHFLLEVAVKDTLYNVDILHRVLTSYGADCKSVRLKQKASSDTMSKSI